MDTVVFLRQSWQVNPYVAPQRKSHEHSFQRQTLYYDLARPSVHERPSVVTRSYIVSPLLGKRVQSPFGLPFQSVFNSESQPFLDDHRLHKIVVVPAAAYLSMCLSAAVHLHGCGPHLVENVSFPQPLVLHDDKVGSLVQLTLTPMEKSKYQWTVHSLDSAETSDSVEASASGKGWILHTTGELNVSPNGLEQTNVGVDYLVQHRAQCPEHLSSEEFYDKLWECGYHLGECFRWIGPIVRNRSGHAVCEMRSPRPEERINEYELFPGLIDSCFQVMGSVLMESVDDTTYIPMHVERFKYYRRPNEEESLHCHVVERARVGSNREVAAADVRLLDKSGNLFAEIENVRLKKADASVLIKSRPRQEDVFFEVSWIPDTLVVSSSNLIPGTWLIFGDEGVVTREVKRILRQGQEVVMALPGSQFHSSRTPELTFTLDGNNREHVDAMMSASLWSELPPLVGIVHLWGLVERQHWKEYHAFGTVSVLNIVRVLVLRSMSPRLWLITRGTQFPEPSSEGTSSPSMSH